MRPKQRYIKRKWLIVGIVAIIVAAGIGLVTIYKHTDKVDQTNGRSSAATNYVQNADKIRLIAVGDMLPHDVINARAKTDTGYSYAPFFTNVSQYFNNADIRFCNDEVPIAGDKFAISGYPVFNAPSQFAKDINNLGCDVINTANNHAFDKGQAGIAETRSVWDTLHTKAVAGSNRSAQEQATIRYFTVKGVKFAFLAYAEYSNIPTPNAYDVNIYSADIASKQVADARKQADIVLVSMHWGTEYSKTPNQMQLAAAKVLADNGADIVIGTGPHVVQPFAKLAKAGGGNTFVWYSLGNFLNAQLDIDSLIGGFAIMDISVKNNKPTTIATGFMPTYMHYEWTTAQKANQDLLARTNLALYPLDKAANPMAKSQNNTTVQEQTAAITSVLNQLNPVRMVTSVTFNNSL